MESEFESSTVVYSDSQQVQLIQSKIFNRLPDVSGRVYHHTVLCRRSPLDIVKELSEFRVKQSGFLMIAYHRSATLDGHFHVLHSCASLCRCRCYDYGFGTLFAGQRRKWKNTGSNYRYCRPYMLKELLRRDEFDLEHWQNLLAYLIMGPDHRQMIYLRMSNSALPIYKLNENDFNKEDALDKDLSRPVQYRGTLLSLLREQRNIKNDYQ